MIPTSNAQDRTPRYDTEVTEWLPHRRHNLAVCPLPAGTVDDEAGSVGLAVIEKVLSWHGLPEINVDVSTNFQDEKWQSLVGGTERSNPGRGYEKHRCDDAISLFGRDLRVQKYLCN